MRWPRGWGWRLRTRCGQRGAEVGNQHQRLRGMAGKVGELGDVLFWKCSREGVVHRLCPMTLRLGHCPSHVAAFRALVEGAMPAWSGLVRDEKRDWRQRIRTLSFAEERRTRAKGKMGSKRNFISFVLRWKKIIVSWVFDAGDSVETDKWMSERWELLVWCAWGERVTPAEEWV